MTGLWRYIKWRWGKGGGGERERERAAVTGQINIYIMLTTESKCLDIGKNLDIQIGALLCACVCVKFNVLPQKWAVLFRKCRNMPSKKNKSKHYNECTNEKFITILSLISTKEKCLDQHMQSHQFCLYTSCLLKRFDELCKRPVFARNI